MWKTIASVFLGIAGGVIVVYATIFIVSRVLGFLAFKDPTFQLYFSFAAFLLVAASVAFGPWLGEKVYRGNSKPEPAPKAVQFAGWLILAAFTLFFLIHYRLQHPQ
jgi:hypothetical protein